MAWSRAFQKCIICHFLDKFFFANIFTKKLDFAIKKSIFANLQIFLQILKVEHKSFLMMYHLSYFDIKHGIYRGVKLTPSPSKSWFSSTPAGIGLNCHNFKWHSISRGTCLIYNGTLETLPWWIKCNIKSLKSFKFW